jgi:hypothetical protein
MFERNKVDNSTELAAVPVELRLDDGAIAKGKLWISRSRGLADVLNGPVQYLDFETYEGARSLIAKATVKAAKVVHVDRPGNLAARLGDDSFDPYAVLGVSRDADWAEVRQAFLARSKHYHPDRYANAELPQEVRDYLAAMARRINTAYAALETAQEKAAAILAARCEPVCTSAGRR